MSLTAIRPRLGWVAEVRGPIPLTSGSDSSALMDTQPTHLIAVSGAPAAGKTRLAPALAQRLGFAHPDLDGLVGALTGAALRLAGEDDAGVDGRAGQALRAARYETLVRAAHATLATGTGVVLSAPLTCERASVQRWREFSERFAAVGGLSARVTLVYVDAPPQARMRRLAARGESRDAGKLEHRDLPASPLAREISAIVVDGADCDLSEQLQRTIDALTDAGVFDAARGARAAAGEREAC